MSNANTAAPTLATDLAQMMGAWDRIAAAARREFPNASDEELYQITAGAMNHALGLSKR